MKKVYITFGGEPFDLATKNIVQDGVRYGVDEVIVYDDAWLVKQDFYKRNIWLWEHHHKRGFGWYSWKPFIIYHTLQKLNDGDIVLYTDADCYPINNLSVLFEQCNKDGGIMLFRAQNCVHWHWCKKDCFVVMGQDEEKYKWVPAGVARFMLFQKGPWMSTQFLMEWLTYCVNPSATTFDSSKLGQEQEGFVEHRTEQAIMTNLAYKYGLKLYREADGYGEHPWCRDESSQDRDLYQQLFIQYNLSDIPGKTRGTFEPKGSKYANTFLS